MAATPGTTPALRKVALFGLASALRGFIVELEGIEATRAPEPARRQ